MHVVINASRAFLRLQFVFIQRLWPASVNVNIKINLKIRKYFSKFLFDRSPFIRSQTSLLLKKKYSNILKTKISSPSVFVKNGASLELVPKKNRNVRERKYPRQRLLLGAVCAREYCLPPRFKSARCPVIRSTRGWARDAVCFRHSIEAG